MTACPFGIISPKELILLILAVNLISMTLIVSPFVILHHARSLHPGRGRHPTTIVGLE